MRKTLLLAFLLGCGFLSHAQVEKGKWIAGAGFQLTRYEGKGEEVSAGGAVTQIPKGVSLFLSFTAEAAWQISKKGAAGIGLTYANPTNKSYNTDGTLREKHSNPSLKIYAFYQLQKKIVSRFTYNPRIEGYYQNKNTNDFNYRVRSNYYGTELKPLNFRYFLSHKIFLEAGLASLVFEYNDYASFQTDKTVKGKITSLYLNATNVLNSLTIQFIF